MNSITRWTRTLCAAALALSAAGTMAQGAAAYPDRPIKMIVPFGPGSGTDAIARTMAKALGEETGQSVVVENRFGGEGFIGVQAVASAPPDGYTILLGSSSAMVMNTFLFKKLPYDPIKDFVAVAPLSRTAMLMNVNAKFPAASVQQFIDEARKNPGGVSFGSGSATTRLAGEFFAQQAGVKLLHVPYRTPALAINDLLGEQVNMVFVDLPTVAGHLKAGKLRALAVSGQQRMSSMPDIPTLRELGLKDYELTAWYGIWMPAGTPRPVVLKMNALVAKVMKTQPVQTFFANASMDVIPTGTPEEFLKFEQEDAARIGQVMKAAGVEPQ